MNRITLFAVLLLLTITATHQGFELKKQLTPDKDSSRYSLTTMMDLRYQKMKQLPVDISYYKNLERLDISHNPIDSLSLDLQELSKLRRLYLNNMDNLDIEQAMKVVSTLPLEELEMNGNNMLYMPSKLAACNRLKKLSLQNNSISQLNEDFLISSEVESLDLSHNQIDSLPETINDMSELRELKLSYNPCMGSDYTYQLLAHNNTIKRLEIQGCTSLPEQCRLADSIQELSLSNSKICYLPQGIGKCLSLKKVELNNCPNLDYAQALTTLSAAGRLKSLQLKGEKMLKLGEALTKCKELEELELGSEVQEIPADLSALQHLRSVSCNISDTGSLNKLILALRSCASLKTLDISGAGLKELPASIAQLKQLEYLNISFNALKTVPEELYKLSQLMEIDLRGNQLEAETAQQLMKTFEGRNIYLDNYTYTEPGSTYNTLTVDLPVENYTVNAETGGSLKTEKGTVITIPEQAFVDEKGNPVKGKVELSFREFYDPATIYASKINMNYDSAGVTNGFQSAGMFELLAKQNKRALKMRPGKKVKVDFVSYQPLTSFNYYQYNPSNQSWKYRGKDNIKKASAANTTRATQNNPYVIQLPQPQKKDYLKYTTFKLSVFPGSQDLKANRFALTGAKCKRWNKGEKDYSMESNEIAVFKNVKWIYDTQDKKEFKKKILAGNKFFDEKRVKKRNLKKDCLEVISKENKELLVSVLPDLQHDRFNLVFTCSADSLVIPAYLDLKRRNPLEVQKEYKRLYEEYSKRKAKADVRRAEQKRAYDLAVENYEAQMAQYRRAMKAANAAARKALEKEEVNNSTIKRSLDIDGFGVWNCDIVPTFEVKARLLASFTNELGETFPYQTILMIDLSKNGYLTYSNGNITIDQKSNYLIVVQQSDNTIGVTRYTSQVQDGRSQTITFNLKTYQTQGMSVKELREKVFNL